MIAAVQNWGDFGMGIVTGWLILATVSILIGMSRDDDHPNGGHDE